MLLEENRTVQSLDALDDDRELQARLVRKTLKTRFQGQISYRQGDYIEGIAQAKNLGNGDIALFTHRYLGAGDAIALELDCLTYRGLPITMSGTVIKCAASKDGSGFNALVHVHRGRS